MEEDATKTSMNNFRALGPPCSAIKPIFQMVEAPVSILVVATNNKRPFRLSRAIASINFGVTWLSTH